MRLKEIIGNWMERIRQLRERARAARQERKKCELISHFAVYKRYGKLWIVCDGIAVREIHPHESAAEIIDQVNRFYRAALEYEYYEVIE